MQMESSPFHNVWNVILDSLQPRVECEDLEHDEQGSAQPQSGAKEVACVMQETTAGALLPVFLSRLLVLRCRLPSVWILSSYQAVSSSPRRKIIRDLNKCFKNELIARRFEDAQFQAKKQWSSGDSSNTGAPCFLLVSAFLSRLDSWMIIQYPEAPTDCSYNTSKY